MKKLSLLIIFVCSVSMGQNKDKELFKGNQFFSQKEYVDAETAFRISSSKNENKKAVSSYNLGTSIYKQDLPNEAKIQFMNTIDLAKTKEEKHKAYHNLGNTLMAEKNYQQAAEAYKNALRNNPYDEETRYNYALAKKHHKENPPKKDDKKGGGGGQNDKEQQPNQSPQSQDNKDQDTGSKGNNKDKKDSDKGNEDQNKNKGNTNEDKKEGDKDEDTNGNPKPTGANKQQIENLLEAVNNAEKKIQDKLNAKQVKSNPVKTDKDW